MKRNSILSLCVIALHTRCIVALQLGQPNAAIAINECHTRRGILVSAAAASLATITSIPNAAIAMATDGEQQSAQLPKVTSLVTLDISINRAPSQPLRIELFGEASPSSSQFFSTLASGKLQAPCAMGDGSNIEICEEYQGITVGYKGSQCWRIVPDKRLDFGRVDSMFASRVPPTFAAESNADDGNDGNGSSAMKASTRGAVSVKRGGGAFEFTIAPKYNPSLDDEELVAIGRVAPEDMAYLDVINAIPSRRDIIQMGDVPPLGSKFARACDFTAPDSTCAQYKPLKKIIVTEASVASL